MLAKVGAASPRPSVATRWRVKARLMHGMQDEDTGGPVIDLSGRVGKMPSRRTSRTTSSISRSATRNGERPWTAGIRDPRSASHLLATLGLEDEVVATSGDYEHFVDVDGRRYHHLLDPRTGYPASASRSATVIAPDGALAEALSTALFVLGPSGLEILSAIAKTSSLLVDGDGVAHFTATGNARFKSGAAAVDVAGSPR